MPARAIRRAATARVKATTRRKLRRWGVPTTPRNVGRWAACPAKCSCHMCGNARRIEGPTMQERRAALADRDT